jgi:DNA-binding NarL/FixJ family response regulator
MKKIMLKPRIDTNIYLVDHDPAFILTVNKSIDNTEKYNIRTFNSGEKFIAHLKGLKFKNNDIYIVFLGYKYFDEGSNTLMNGIEVLEATKVVNKDIEVVMLTGPDEGSYGSYVMKCGAYTFIPKNENIHLRINNIIMGIISQKRLTQKRRRFIISLKIIIGYILLFVVIWVIYKIFFYKL